MPISLNCYCNIVGGSYCYLTDVKPGFFCQQFMIQSTLGEIELNIDEVKKKFSEVWVNLRAVD